MLQPLPEHALLPFILQLLLLLVVARLLGELMRRIGQPAVVGELGAGLLLGPSVFGRLLPGVADGIFTGGMVGSAPTMAVAQLGVILVLVITGFETDLRLLRGLGRSSATTSLASLALPLAAGYAVGVGLPEGFLGPQADRLTFAMFVALAVSISALAVSGRILTELDLMRRDVGQLIVGVALINELVGWVLLGLIVGVVLDGGFNLTDLLVTVASLTAFLALALTVGQRLTDRLLRGARAVGTGTAGALTTSVVVSLLAAAVTQAIGVEAALGAFVAGIVLGRSRYQSKETIHTIEVVTNGVFAPIFFATAGLFVDVGAIATPRRLFWFAVLLGTALVTKFLGSYLGARVGGTDRSTGVAVGVGLNARGTLEIVLATIALTIGVFNAVSYSTVVLVAMVSALVTPPGLRAALRRVRPSDEEAQRLERERVLATSVIADVEQALVPTRGGENSRLAARVLDLVLKPEAAVTVLTVHQPDHPDERCSCEAAMDSASAALGTRTVDRRRTVSDDPAEAVLKETALGYGLVALGMTDRFRETHELSKTLRDLLSRSTVPLLLVRHGHGASPGEYQRIVVPITGTRIGRAAQEVAYTLAAQTGASLDLLHVVARHDRSTEPVPEGRLDRLARSFTRGAPPPGPSGSSATPAEGLLVQAVARAGRFGVEANDRTLEGVTPYEGVLKTAADVGADTIVLAAQVRASEGGPFLGHGTEYLLEHAAPTVVVIVFPGDEQDDRPGDDD
ncbi:MAG: cation:proton antiporter [Actinobacteria bacterium]|nr:cation:proton antiporter [Actinomycetota bacterium]